MWLLGFAVVFAVTLVALFAISDVLADRRAQHERTTGELPSYVRRVPRGRAYDQDADQ